MFVRQLTSLFVAALLLAPPALAAPEATYRLRYGDALTIQVLGDERLQVERQPIRPDGRISMPMIGEVQAGGATVAELSQRLREAYARLVLTPQVVVQVATFRPLRINVIGMVNRPGTYQTTEPVPLLEALALAGGLDRDRADLQKVVVIQPNGQRRVVDLAAILRGEAPDGEKLADGATVQVAEATGPDWYRLLPTVAAGVSVAASLVMMLLATR